MKDSLRTAWTAVGLGLGSLLLFVQGIGRVAGMYYDESLFVLAGKALLAGAPNPNPEAAPPLGKQLVAVGIAIFGDNAVGWRVPGAVFGALTVVGVFFLAYLLLKSYSLALTAALLAVLNNFLYVMSRVAMMDSFFVAFLIWGLVGFCAAIELEAISTFKRRGLLVFSGAMFGFACACKWNGVDTLGIVIAVAFVLLLISLRTWNPEFARHAENLEQAGRLWTAFSLLAVPVVAYLITYGPLLHSLHRPYRLGEIVAMNKYIWEYHRHVTGNPAITRPWYAWPFQVSPQRGLAYLVGNWFVMWAGLVALILCARRFMKSLPETLVILLYLGNLLQWAVTPQSCLYYYYYFPSAMFAGLAIPIALRQFPERLCGVRLSVACVALAACVFIYCFPHMALLQAPFDCALGCWP
jgi:dolichyl-phosphate-mannose--protein O-mannosyl transferase